MLKRLRAVKACAALSGCRISSRYARNDMTGMMVGMVLTSKPISDCEQAAAAAAAAAAGDYAC
jgi:hypothetical protein